MKATHIAADLSDEKSVYIVLDPPVHIEDAEIANAAIAATYANLGGSDSIKVDGGLILSVDLATSITPSELQRLLNTISDAIAGRHEEVRAILESVSQSLRLPITDDETKENIG